MSRMRGLRASGKKLRQRPLGARLTTRTAILALVVCALVLSISYPLRQYLAQRGQIAKLEQQNDKAQQLVNQYERRAEQLNDPSYIAQEARERLQYVYPGEIPFVVVDKSTPKPTPTPTPSSTTTAGPSHATSWYSNLWDSVQKANQ
jgi:cell division protein FtsB